MLVSKSDPLPTPLQTREQHTAAYDNSAAVPNAPALLHGLLSRSQAVYAQHACLRNIPYGPGPRQVFDWFAPTQPSEEMVAASAAPILVFLHGGYWQWRSKDDFACIAAGPLAAGFHVVLGEYTLAPQARMLGIVAEIGLLLDTLQSHSVLGQPQGQPRIVLAGHSAGGHLAAMHRTHPAVAAVLAISGVFELAPIARGALNDALQLSEMEIAACSPQRCIQPGCTTEVACGAAELPELQRQSHAYAAALQAAGEPAQLHVLPGCNHFDILHELERPEGPLLILARRLAKGAGLGPAG